MKKILLITTLFSFNCSGLKPAEASLDSEALEEQKDIQAIAEIDEMAIELEKLETSRVCCAQAIERLGIENYNTKLNVKLQELERMKNSSRIAVGELAFFLITHDKVAPLKKLFEVAKRTNKLALQTLYTHPWLDTKTALLQFSAYTAHLNQKNCIPILRILEQHGVDLTKPAIICDLHSDSRIDLTNALEIAQQHKNEAVIAFLLPYRNWSLEEARKEIEGIQPEEKDTQRDFSAAAEEDSSTLLEQMLAKTSLGSTEEGFKN